MLRTLLLTTAAAVLVLAFSSSVNAAAPATVTMGLLAQFTTANTNPPVVAGIQRPISSYTGFGLGSDRFAAAIYQIDQINAAGTLLPQTQLKYQFYDDQQTAARGVAGAQELLANGSRVILGGGSSSVSQAAAPIIAAAATGQLAWSSAASDLSNKTAFPNFMRVAHNDAYLAGAMAYLIKNKFSWSDIAILYTTDTYGAGGFSDFSKTAQNLGINIILSQGFATTSNANVMLQYVQNIKNCGAKVVVFYGQAIDWATTASVIQKQGLFNAQMVWFLSSASTGSTLFTDAQRASWHGVIGIGPDSGSDTQGYKTWLAGFLARPINPIPELRWNGTASDVSLFTAFAADAVSVVAYGLKQLIVTEGKSEFTNLELLAAMKNVDIQGITGPIKFDSNGDRIGINFVLSNLQTKESSDWIPIGKVASLGAGTYSYTEGSNGATIFYDGTSNVPSSTPSAAVPPSSVLVGILAQFTAAGSNPPVVAGVQRPMSDYTGFGLGSDRFAAAAYQIDQINAGTMLPKTKINYLFYDDQQTVARGTQGAQEMLNNGTRVLMGASSSSISAAVSPLAAAAKEAMVSWSSAAGILSNKTAYPNFMRLSQSDTYLANAMAYLIKSKFSWSDIAIIYTTDTYGQGGYNDLVSACSANSINIISAQGVAVNSGSDVVTPLVQSVKNSGAKIVVFFGQANDWIQTAAVAKAQGMFNAQTVWILSSAPLAVSIYTDAQRADWHGVIGVAPDSGSDLASYQTWRNGFVSRPINPIPELRWNGTASDVSFYAAFAADTINVVANALQTLIVTNGNYYFTSQDLLAAMKAVDFVGITGRIRFDANGDRMDINFILKNMQSSQWVNVAKIAGQTSFTYSAVDGASIMFYDGTSNVPSSTPTPTGCQDTACSAIMQSGVSMSVMMVLALAAVKMMMKM